MHIHLGSYLLTSHYRQKKKFKLALEALLRPPWCVAARLIPAICSHARHAITTGMDLFSEVCACMYDKPTHPAAPKRSLIMQIRDDDT